MTKRLGGIVLTYRCKIEKIFNIQCLLKNIHCYKQRTNVLPRNCSLKRSAQHVHTLVRTGSKRSKLRVPRHRMAYRKHLHVRSMTRPSEL